MSPLVLALGASLAWGVADFVGPLWARGLGTLRVLFWAQIGGVLAIGAAVAVRGEGPGGWAVAWAALAAVSAGLGIMAYYHGMATGTMSVVAPIAGASAGIPVLLGIATGDRPSAAQVAGILLALAGVILASLYPIVTVGLAAAVLHERIARSQKVGVVLTLAGVLLISV